VTGRLGYLGREIVPDILDRSGPARDQCGRRLLDGEKPLAMVFAEVLVCQCLRG
jgi:hypothetical protein